MDYTFRLKSVSYTSSCVCLMQKRRKRMRQKESWKSLSHQPEEVLPAIKFPISWEAFLGQLGLAVGTLNAFGVPGLVQHIQQESVVDGPITARADRHHLSHRRLGR